MSSQDLQNGRLLAVLLGFALAGCGEDRAPVQSPPRQELKTVKSPSKQEFSEGGGANLENLAIRNRNNLNEISKGCATYLGKFGGNKFYPASLAELCERGILDRSILVSPLDSEPPKLPNGFPCSYESVFDRYTDRAFLEDLPPTQIVAWDRLPFYRHSRSVVYLDSHVEVIVEETFQGVLRQLDEAAKNLPRRTPQK